MALFVEQPCTVMLTMVCDGQVNKNFLTYSSIYYAFVITPDNICLDSYGVLINELPLPQLQIRPTSRL